MVLKRVKQKQISLGYCDTRTGQRVYPPPPVDQMTDLLPEQRPPEPPVVENMYGDVKLTCHPPLAQSTTIPREDEDVWFTVLLERPVNVDGMQGWEEPQVCLWHNFNAVDEWTELRLKPTAGNDDTLMINHSTNIGEGSTAKTWFAAPLPGRPTHSHAVQFTLKYRIGPQGRWHWIKDSTGIKDGELLYLSPTSQSLLSSSFIDLQKKDKYNLPHFISNISPDIEVKTAEPECSNTLLYVLTCPVSAASGQESGYSHHRLGTARHARRWFALVRLWSPWLAPRHGEGASIEGLDKEGVMLSFLRADGLHVCCLAVSGVGDILATFIPGEGGGVEVKGRNDAKEEGKCTVLVAVAEEFERACAAVMYHARKVVAETGSAGEVEDEGYVKVGREVEEEGEGKGVEVKWLEEWYDGLSYCTWNGLGQDLSAEKILDALQHLSANKINITNLIIDDNWQSLSGGETQFQRGWSDFEANSAGFPNGLKGLTGEIRSKFPHVEHIAVWHALLGYWGGIDPNGKIASKYKTIEVEKEPGVAGGKFTVIAPEDAKQMYEDFYYFLQNNGIDAVKTDAQFFLDLLLHAPDRRKMMDEYQDAWTLAHLRHFTSRAISCMSQFPQSIFHNQLPLNRPRLLVRNSDDFFPEVEASHSWHIFCNAHNSVLTQHLNALPDWDMFQTSHDWAAFHAAARCVSGGPIYITDKPGQHDLELIGGMSAQTVQGKTVILRPQNVGRTIGVYNSYDAGVLLKVGTYVGVQGTGSGILGVFNVSKGILREFVPLDCFPGTEEGEYVVLSFRLGEVSKPMRRGGQNAFVGVEMGARGWEILTAFAVRSFTIPGQHGQERNTQIAVLGLLGKMTGAAATRLTDMVVESNGRLKMWISLKALGVLGLWISDLQERSVEDDFMVMMYGKPVPVHCVKKSTDVKAGGGGGGVLEIDLATAWRENGEVAGYSNQAEVDIYMS